jgi:hypothetical protein
MTWEEIIKRDLSGKIEILLNQHIFDKSDYNDKMAKLIERKLKEDKIDAKVEYVEDDISFYIMVANNIMYKFDEKGRLTRE